MLDEIRKSQTALTDLCHNLREFLTDTLDEATYKAPIIDHHHPDDYRQKGISGLRKFLSHAETEKDYVTGLAESTDPPKEFTSNAPHILAVWDELRRAKWPISSVTQTQECGKEGQAKIDIVAEGGNLWIKVNTIRINRLLSEFREQDSYINSDYDSDSSDSNAESSTAPAKRASTLTNSILTQAESLIRAAKSFPRAPGLPTPRLRYVLNRLEEYPEKGYSDPRVAATFTALREMGIELVLGQPSSYDTKRNTSRQLLPRRDILLDLSIIVALCCDTTHHPLPPTTDSLEARFRPYTLTSTGERVLTPHTSLSKDLRDQLQWEMQHPLIDELKDRLRGYEGEQEVRFWVTKEVKERVPGILDVIGGPGERARASALFGDGGVEGFWKDSRYQGDEGVLRHIRARVLEEEEEELGVRKLGIGNGDTKWSFEKGLLATCSLLLHHAETPTSDPSSRSPTPTTTPIHDKRRNGRRSRNPNRPTLVFPANSNLPSPHTLRSLIAGVERGMTVLTNNRGAVGKVIREMGVREGIPENDDEPVDGVRRSVVWVVNPSSLAEWRRIEVEESNEALPRSAVEA